MYRFGPLQTHTMLKKRPKKTHVHLQASMLEKCRMKDIAVD